MFCEDCQIKMKSLLVYGKMEKIQYKSQNIVRDLLLEWDCSLKCNRNLPQNEKSQLRIITQTLLLNNHHLFQTNHLLNHRKKMAELMNVYLKSPQLKKVKSLFSSIQTDFQQLQVAEFHLSPDLHGTGRSQLIQVHLEKYQMKIITKPDYQFAIQPLQKNNGYIITLSAIQRGRAQTLAQQIDGCSAQANNSAILESYLGSTSFCNGVTGYLWAVEEYLVPLVNWLYQFKLTPQHITQDKLNSENEASKNSELEMKSQLTINQLIYNYAPKTWLGASYLLFQPQFSNKTVQLSYLTCFANKREETANY